MHNDYKIIKSIGTHFFFFINVSIFNFQQNSFETRVFYFCVRGTRFRPEGMFGSLTSSRVSGKKNVT